MRFKVEQKTETPKYPYLGIWTSETNPVDWDIVYFWSYDEGIVVASHGEGSKVGEHWDDEDIYKPFDGKVILEND